jgi:hypothetical protein
MATTIFFNGRVISVPGSYSEVDASGLEQVGLGAAGIVAVLGMAEGGAPVSSFETEKDIFRFTKPEQGNTTFKSGDLREVTPMLFAPAKDPDILAGAQEVVPMKVNPATQSSATFANTFGDAMDALSRDFGAFTEQVNVSIQDGTTKGKLITIIFEDITESQDDLGGDDFFKLKYTGGGDAWATMVAQVQAGGNVKADGTRGENGLDSDVGTPLAAPGAIEVVSTDVGDTQQITVYGLDGSGNAVSETLVLTGTTPKVGTQVFGAGDVLGASIVGTTLGTVTVEPSGGGAAVFSMTAGANPKAGLERGTAMFVSGSKVTLVSDGASVKDVILVGNNASGSPILEKITLTGTTPVVGLADFSLITAIVLGDVEAAQIITASAEAAKSLGAVQNTLQKVLDFFAAKYDAAATKGFVPTLVTARTTFDPDLLDVSTATQNALDPADADFKADLNEIIEWVNQNSALMSLTKSTGATGGAPDNTTSPVFLTGGSEGTTTFQNWQDALNLLKRIRVNSVVVLTPDPAVHAALDAHCAFMGGIGRSERDGFAGIMNTAMTDVATKTEIKDQIVDLNTRHIRVWAQAFERFDTFGERQEFNPPFGGALLAGAQAGSPVGTSLTYKFLNLLSLRQHSTWNPTDDAEEMIQAGLVFAEVVEGVGRRVVRNVTTHLSSNNIAFTEGSVNEAVNISVFNFRTNLEFAVGKPGFSGTINASQGIAIATLGLLVDAGTITQYRSLDIELIVDVLEVSVELSPVIPINFVKSTVHLVTIQQAAA